MNNPSEAYYQLRYDFTLHYLFVVYEHLLLLLDFDKYIRPLKKYGNSEKNCSNSMILNSVFIFFWFIMKLE